MSNSKSYFFCGIGAAACGPCLDRQARGSHVAGSDRSRDQGRTPDKFERLAASGFKLHPQDGSGVTSADQIVVVSAAIEETVPDVMAARRIGATIVTRPELLSELFNAAGAQDRRRGTSANRRRPA